MSATVPDLGGLPVEHVPTVVVGGGPSGLAAATGIADRTDGDVLVLEREHETGGIPRHSDHPGYGLRDLQRFVSGPVYARRLSATAREAGVRLETGAQVTGWLGPRELLVTSPRGRRVVSADAVVLATGARERPRPARMVPGDRPAGVLTTGQLQNLVHLHRGEVGTRAVVVGGELVSWSAAVTLRDAGCRTVAMTTTYARSEAYLAFRVLGRVALRVPVRARTRLISVHGKRRVEGVVVEHLDTGERETIACDTVVTTGDWVPDHELVRLAGLELDPHTRGPVVGGDLRTSGHGIFAVGNLVHPVDTADAAALDGRYVAAVVAAWLSSGEHPAAPAIQVRPGPGFRWVTPQRLAPGEATPRDHLLLWPEVYRRLPRVRAVQDGTVLAEHRLLWPASPGRVFRVPRSLVAGASVQGGPVSIELAGS